MKMKILKKKKKKKLKLVKIWTCNLKRLRIIIVKKIVKVKKKMVKTRS